MLWREGRERSFGVGTKKNNQKFIFLREQPSHTRCERPDWGVYSKRGRQVCIASTCLLVNFREASFQFCFCTRKDWLTKKGKFVSDIPRKSAPFVPSRVGASKHETCSRMGLRNMQKWTFSRTVLWRCKIWQFL